MERETRLSSTLFIITRWYEYGRISLSISHMCVSGEANLRPRWILREKPPKKKKNPTRGEFSNYGRCIMSCHLIVKGWKRMKSCRFFIGEWRHVIWDMKETQIAKIWRAEKPERKERISPLNEPVLRGIASLVKRIPKEKTCPRGKRQILNLVLSEIKSVFFYQRVVETL